MSRPIDASLPGFLGNGETNSTVTDNQNETVYHLSSPSVSSAAVPGVALDIASTTNSVLAPCEAQTHETNEAALYFGPNMATGREFASVDPRDGGPISEIQEIMGQFDNNDMTLKVQAHESPRLSPEFPSLNLSTNHPPRKSSLKPFRAASVHSESSSLLLPGSASVNDISEVQRKMVEVTMNDQRSIQVSGHATRLNSGDINNIPHSSPASASSQKPHPPEPESAPGLSFDFHRFLEQLRHRTADPVAKFLRSFLVEFGKKQWMPHEQAKIIGDFLAFIANKMALCEIWRELSDAEFDNAKEGMEKLVMNRLYSQTFSPAIPNPTSVPRAKNKGTILDRSVGRGRTGQHQEDIERDEILSQKVRIYGWVREEHLDILHVGDGGKRFLALAQQGM